MIQCDFEEVQKNENMFELEFESFPSLASWFPPINTIFSVKLRVVPLRIQSYQSLNFQNQPVNSQQCLIDP